MSTKTLFKKYSGMDKEDPQKKEGWFHTVSSPATMSLYYKPFSQSGLPTQQKEATF